ncbi:MAG: hypothetical protein ACE5G1_00270 [bacterium]
MVGLLQPLKATMNGSTLNDFMAWFSQFPSDAAWYVISDYCFGDRTKQSDTVSFSILLNHDKIVNIKEYINAFSPKDIKSSRTVSPGFLKYINSPVIFNMTFLIDRSTKLLSAYSSAQKMKDFLPQFKNVVKMIQKNSSIDDDFFESTQKRLDLFESEFERKSPNLRLSRQIYLVSIFAGIIFYYLTKAKNPSYIQWISDRDAIVERHDGLIYDLSYFIFHMEYSNFLVGKDSSTKRMPEKPHFIFPPPAKTGKNQHDELVRIPDYLAGTLADYNVERNEFSKDKYYSVLEYSLINSPNHAIIHISGSDDGLSSRRYVFKR